ncbi:Armadillo-type fold [Elaphomyces granulatus]
MAFSSTEYLSTLTFPDSVTGAREVVVESRVMPQKWELYKQNFEHQNSRRLVESQASEMDMILARFPPKPKSSLGKTSITNDILTKLSEQQILLDKQQSELLNNNVRSAIHEDNGSSAASPVTPATAESIAVSAPTDREGNRVDPAEMLRLRQELQAAKSRLALQEQELAQTRVIKHTLEQLGPETDLGGPEQTINNMQSAFNASARAFSRPDSWNVQDDARSDISNALSASTYNRTRGLWPPYSQQAFGFNANLSNEKGYHDSPTPSAVSVTQDTGRNWPPQNLSPGYYDPGLHDPGHAVQAHPAQNHTVFHPHRVLSGPSSAAYNFDTRGYTASEQSQYLAGPNLGPRRSITQVNRGGSCFPPQNSPWGTFTAGAPSGVGTRPLNQPIHAYQQMGPGVYPVPYQPRPIGTPLSPTAAEFTSTGASWSTPSINNNSTQTYVSPFEPINYRRLLDKNVYCDWRVIVDKIVCNNDQQASIFLQQKLKVGTAEQKYDIIEAIVNQAYPLMVNRFGNFLVQRCFEHGTPEQVVSIANAIKGNTLSLSMDPFGCHVVQKAFDCVPEEHKAVMVHELLRRIPETVIHRYACHVWQKLFELRWSNEPPQIMAKVNEALRGMWHEVALGETGSLVVQNIFENCVEDEKRQAIEEVLAKIDLLSHGQFGNWCIQHICEHGAPADKSRAIEHILDWCIGYSMDQFASKVVEKCLKIGGSDFLERYLQRVCAGRPDRPRMPLIDIAGDQYGNYLIQWILVNAQALHHREVVASHIRKHMVSLRGSKFGSRVAMLCCNPSHATRPGPGAGVQVSRFGGPNDDRLQMTGAPGGRFSRNNQWNPGYPAYR